MEMSADFSHYVIDREIRVPISPELKGQFSRVIDRPSSFQGRIASRQQIQLPLHFPQTAKWLDLFTDWWREGFQKWRARRPITEDCALICELGPPEYAITDEQGRELSDRWTEAQQLRRIAQQCWADAG